MSALISLENVRFSSRSRDLVKDASFEIEKGSVTSIFGKSGSGKSTVLKLAAGILVPSDGRVLWKENDIQLMSDSQNKTFRRHTAFVFQDSALWANQSILQNMILPLKINRPELREKERLELVMKTLDDFSFHRSVDLRPSDLSSGEQKVVAFARAFVSGPDTLFLDECTESLDKNGARNIIRVLHAFVEKGNTIVYVSHNFAFITEFPGNVYVVEDGRVSASSVFHPGEFGR